MADSRPALGPLGRRLLVAFVIVALSSVGVLTLAALFGTARGLASAEQGDRTSATAAAAASAGTAYAESGGWDGADLSAADAAAAAAGARLVVYDSLGTLAAAPGRDGVMRPGMGAGMGQGMATAAANVVTAPVVVAGATVGSVRLGFGASTAGAAQGVAWAWIVAAALVALVVAVAASWAVTRRIAGPLTRLSAAARTFAAGDRSARADIGDVDAPGELGELARAFDATAAQVERSETARQRMSADLAHELRTPLAALQAGLEELRDGLVEPDEARLTALHDQSVRMGRVVQDLAELAAAESSALSLQRGLVDLGVVVDGAVESARATLTGAGIVVDCRCAPGTTIVGDEDRLHQVVGNLLANTGRHCRAGDSVRVDVSRAQDDAVLVIADTGPGIDPADLPRVFDRLWRGRADRDSEGSGIGLAVVRELVVAHGGTVTADSDGSHGTTITIVLPLARTSPAPGVAPAADDRKDS